MKSIFKWVMLTIIFTVGASVLVGNKTVYAAEKGDVITKIFVTDQEGQALTGDISQGQKFRINVDFDLKGYDVHAGDTTIVQLPREIVFFGNTSFEVKDTTGKLVATGAVIPGSQNKKIKITYTDYAQTHSFTNGSFFFYVRVDHTEVEQKKEIPIYITVSGKVKNGGKVVFEGIGHPRRDELSKSGWQDDTDPTIGHFLIALNRSGKDMSNTKVVDILRNPNIRYDEKTFSISKGKWVFEKGDWALIDSDDITTDTSIKFLDNKFSMKLPDIKPEEGIEIRYRVKLPHPPTNGDSITSDATLTADSGINTTVQSGYTYLVAGGHAEGYVYSIKVKKVDEEEQSLKDVVFDVIRVRTGKSVGKIRTDAKGEGEIGNLLYDSYVLREVEVPVGYVKTEDIKIEPADFDTSTKSVLKKIVNKRKPTETQAVIKAKKVLEGDNLAGYKFKFILKDDKNQKIEEVINTPTGDIIFKPLTFKEEGVFTYTIEEDQSVGYEGITYADPIKVIIKVTKDVAKNTLVATVEGTENQRIFKNIYTPANPVQVVLEGKKVLEGKPLEADKYSFELVDDKGIVLQTVQNDVDGNIRFAPITYTEDDQFKVFVYKVREVKGSEPGVTYSKDVYEVEVNVIKEDHETLVPNVTKKKGGKQADIVFINRYTPPVTTTTVSPTTTSEASTTVSPTTTSEASTTVSPTTTSEASTTVSPTTTSEASTTVSPTTTSEASTTVSPTTTSEASTTVSPTTTSEASTTVSPTTTSEASTTVSPTTTSEASTTVSPNTTEGTTSVALMTTTVVKPVLPKTGSTTNPLCVLAGFAVLSAGAGYALMGRKEN